MIESRFLSRFPQKIGLKIADMSKCFDELSSMQKKVRDVFLDLLVWFGESEKEYKESSFLKVIYDFYEAFTNEMKQLEKNKKRSEEIRKQKELQEQLTQAAKPHAMDNFQNDTQGKNSLWVSQTFGQSLRVSMARASVTPMPMQPISAPLRTSPLRQLGAPVNRLSYRSMDSSTPNYLDDILSDNQSDSSEFSIHR